MNVLHYRQTFSKLSETFVYEYITGLERQGTDNCVVTHERRNSKARPFQDVYEIGRPGRWHPHRVFYRLLVPFGVGTRRTSEWPEIRRRLKMTAREVDPDVVHAHFGREGVVIGPVTESLGVPLVVTFYGFDISSLPEKDFWAQAYEKLWGQVAAVTVLSERMKAEAKQLGCPEDKLSIVPLSRRLDQLPYRRPSGRVQNVLFVGRLTPKKAPLDAIRAVEQANTDGASLTLDVLGDGPCRGEAEKDIQENSLSENITLHGAVPNERVIEHMREADAFLLPSKTAPDGNREGTPTVLVEAQAIGLPCVSTRHAGIPEMIPEKNHFLLADEGNVDGIGKILCDLSLVETSRLEEIANRGRKKVEEDFNLSKSVKKIKKIYSNIVILKKNKKEIFNKK